MATAALARSNLRKLDAAAWVSHEALNVAPDLLGLPLARPSRRAMAIGLDGLVVGLLSSSGAFWVAAGIAALVFQLRRRQPALGFRRNIWLWLALALLVFVGAQRSVELVDHWGDAPVTAREESSNADEEVAKVLAGLIAAASPASAASAALKVNKVVAERAVQMAARIAKLESELAQARQPRPLRWRDDTIKAVHALGIGFGWAIAYFTLLPVWWQGQTLGKKLFGLRVVELTGKPLGWMLAFGRYGGYAAGMATGGIGFAQVLWDPNRQAIQDKIAHTVVLDLRGPRRDTGPDIVAASPQQRGGTDA